MWPLRRRSTRAPIKLALQGGGAHGAYTWGVLDALLERHGTLRAAAASGTSAGAMNAIVLAHGLAVGGADGARAALAGFWHAVAGGGEPFAWLLDGDGLHAAPRAWLHWTTTLLAPTQWNPMALNPLRDILQQQVDFERLRRAPDALPLFIAATHAASGRLRLFTNRELSVDAALASACLPTLHHTVMIDGEPYWDGAYAANPALFPLICDVPAAAGDDLLLVLLAPLQHEPRLPTRADEIRERTIDIAFNATFLREARMLAEVERRSRHTGWLRRGPLERLVARQRWHLIDGGADLVALQRDSKLIAHRPLLERLRDLGRERALRWLDGDTLGRRSSLDLPATFGPPA
jgi:NTE family protein